MNMDLRQLEYFIAVAELGGFTRASEKLHVVQSTVSAGVRSLERELGAPLIVRTTRRSQLTAAGAELLARGRELLAAERAAVAAVRATTGAVGGLLRVGILAAELPFDLPELLGRFRYEHPAVDLRLLTSPTGSEGLLRDLLDDRLDATFTSTASGHPELRELQLPGAPVDLVVAASHRLASRASVSLAEIADEPFVDFATGFGQRSDSDEAFRSAGFTRRISTETTTAGMALSFVRAGLGVALLPRPAVPAEEGVVRVAVDPELPTWRISFVHHAKRWRSPALDALADLLGRVAV